MSEVMSEQQSEIVTSISASELSEKKPENKIEVLRAYNNEINKKLVCVCFSDGTFVFDEAAKGNYPLWMKVSQNISETVKRTTWRDIRTCDKATIRKEINRAQSLANEAAKNERTRDSQSEISATVQELIEIISEFYERNASDIHCSLRGSDAVFYSRVDGIIDLNPLHRPRADVMRMIAAAIGDAGVENSEDDFNANMNGGTKLDNVLVHKDGEDAYISVRITYRSLSNKTEGDKVCTIRVLNSGQARKLDELNLPIKTERVLRRVMTESYGMVLVTGPTGAGKSTVLMGMMEAKPEDKIAHTIEDPVETLSSDPLVFQGNKKHQIDEVRDLMRMDPDIGQAGEIRNTESLREACGFARTGHLVLASMHATTAIGAFMRMNDMGMSYQQLAEMDLFRMVACQRLVPKLCSCSRRMASYEKTKQAKNSVFKKQWQEWEEVLSEKAFARLKNIGEKEQLRLRNPKGCSKCTKGGTAGILDRQLVFEYILIDDFARKCIREENWDAWKASLIERGWKSMHEQTWELIEQGMVDPEIANSAVSGLLIDSSEERMY
ncbi:TPA: Flp pilus assembly complex ATPase component [Vibrio parahaemolyticus]|uniref:GspE/PulE family protein n=1 Tax=Vibrio campbellii TaxID=680 RepID=UPI00206748CC|nr:MULTISPECIES: ATPase, T2SS/T4P/T4SS family [Vibrio harveyi group]MCR9909633.1 ATPase, T2SS/T4P/T4SS family [Vibrio campbellii]UPR19010.1 Flp pilus assembly complex ATPase component TadA [Vibrio parahaemolyticus]HAV1520109.1 Flp pilus assembly complex ATPase component [Vibrio parahaemolyticus]HAV1539076.1 Flp pilus assembly complex ATPase component [Vibrio parahaemolyticus]